MINSEGFNKLFPSQGSLIVFLSYMMMFVAQGMLVTASRHGSSTYSYNTVTVVLMTEVTKLFGSSIIYLKEYVHIENFQELLPHHLCDVCDVTDVE